MISELWHMPATRDWLFISNGHDFITMEHIHNGGLDKKRVVQWHVATAW